MDEQRLRRLLDAGRTLTAELDYETVLARLLEVAREVTTARYAALGVLNERREGLERFVTAGLDDDAERAIGDRPRGHGILGLLITDPKPLRIADVSAHPMSYGFPGSHPPMTTFLGVPILLDGEAWGNLYLTDRSEGEFTAEDEEAVVILAEWAALAIRNARLYRDVRERRDELERANRNLETMMQIGRALGGETDVGRVLELVAKRSRALLESRIAEIALLDGDEFVVAAGAGEGVRQAVGTRLPVDGSLAASALRSGRTQRFEHVPPGTFAREELRAATAIVTPMVFKARTLGFLMLLDRLSDEQPFSAEHERVLEAFAASAAAAVATAQSATEEALRRSIRASEAERGLWARELHDETLQELAGLRVLLSSARRTGDPDRLRSAVDEGIDLVTQSVANLRALIAELRPAVLDELGLRAALQSLAERVQAQADLTIELDADLPGDGDGRARLPPELESAAYRLVQEALTNVVKHSAATRATVEVRERGDALQITVRDDGRGFATDSPTAGFGVMGMRERAALVNGSFSVRSAPGGGTTVTARLPLLPAGAGRPGDVASAAG